MGAIKASMTAFSITVAGSYLTFHEMQEGWYFDTVLKYLQHKSGMPLEEFLAGCTGSKIMVLIRNLCYRFSLEQVLFVLPKEMATPECFQECREFLEPESCPQRQQRTKAQCTKSLSY